MSKAISKIRFKTKLLRPGHRRPAPGPFLYCPTAPVRNYLRAVREVVEGMINSFPFRATLEPDGKKATGSKWTGTMRESAGAEIGDVVTLEIAPAGEEAEPRVPADLRKALAGAPKARALWSSITPNARKDWIHWIESSKQPETRARRIVNACSMLSAGKRRVCCFDRSGFYSKSFSAPKAALVILPRQRPLVRFAVGRSIS